MWVANNKPQPHSIDKGTSTKSKNESTQSQLKTNQSHANPKPFTPSEHTQPPREKKKTSNTTVQSTTHSEIKDQHPKNRNDGSHNLPILKPLSQKKIKGPPPILPS